MTIIDNCADFIKNRFGYEGPVSHYPFGGGVSHSDDLIYLFPYPRHVAVLNDADTRFAKTLVDLWTSFAINGVPSLFENREGINELTWQPFLGNDIKLAKKCQNFFEIIFRLFRTIWFISSHR